MAELRVVVCVGCSRELPWTLENFAKSSSYKGKVYLLRKCKECIRDYDRRRWLASKERREAHRAAVKKYNNSPAGRAAHKAWRDANPDRCHEMWRSNYQRNGENLRAKNKRWRDNNPEARRALRRNRSAREHGAPGTHSPADVQDIKRKQRWKCFYCRLARIEEIDHYIPLSKGGTNWPENLRGSCRSCNRKKGSKLPWVWKPDRFQEL